MKVKIKMIFDLLRIKQWIKNLFVLIPAFFGGVLLNDKMIVLLGVLTFSLMASSIYIINDIQDIESDRNHPKKCKRPIASNKISVLNAFIVAIILFFVAVSIGFLFLNTTGLIVLVGYFVMNVLYSLYLKSIAIVDLIIVSLGFVFRVIFGAEIVQVDLSHWLLLMTFLFSLFVVLAKRRNDFITPNVEATSLRKVNQYYNIYFFNTAMTSIATLMMFGYLMYTFNSIYFLNYNYLALFSSILVFMGMLRYFQAVFVEDDGGSPTDFALKDRFIQVVVLSWLGIFVYLIYWK